MWEHEETNRIRDQSRGQKLAQVMQSQDPSLWGNMFLTFLLTQLGWLGFIRFIPCSDTSDKFFGFRDMGTFVGNECEEKGQIRWTDWLGTARADVSPLKERPVQAGCRIDPFVVQVLVAQDWPRWIQSQLDLRGALCAIIEAGRCGASFANDEQSFAVCISVWAIQQILGTRQTQKRHFATPQNNTTSYGTSL